MQLYYIRHAQSENNLLWAETGSTEWRSVDPELTPVGREQAEHLARFLAQPGQSPANPEYDPQNVGGFQITHLYCSLMVRSVATGVVLARALDLPLVAWEDAHETGGIHRKDKETGEWIGLPGKNRAYFETHYPDLILPDSLGAEGWWNRPFETQEQRPLRARRFLADLMGRHGNSDHRVAVVSHGGFYRQLLPVLLGLPRPEDPFFSLNNAAITRIDAEDEFVRVRYMNRLDFVPRDLVT
jgi:2,3-bisphosphoglycerate-dependent phosphoglycerate mutase